MDEKRTCYNCGARLRQGARFCSSCGAIIRTNRVEEPAQEQQPIQQPTPQPQPERVPVRETRKPETSQQELYFYEKPAKKSQSRGPKKEPQQKESLSFNLASNNNVLWNCLTAATSLIALAVGIVLLLVNFMTVSYEGYNIALSMNDCFDVLFGKDLPIFYEITVAVGTMCSAVAACALIYLIVAIGYLLYNLIICGKYNKTVLLINTAFSGVLTILSLMILVFYLMMKGKCDLVGGVSNYYSFSIVLLIVSVVVLLLDVVKLTILYQNRLAAQNNPSYFINFLSNFGRNIWKVAGIVCGALAGVAIFVIVLLATAKSPAIKVWENYVAAFNAENEKVISECYYPVGMEENTKVQELYKALFDVEGKEILTTGKVASIFKTEKYVKLTVEGVKYTTADNTSTNHNLSLHFGKVNDDWYLMSYVDITNNGNKVAINSFHKDASATILKINDTTVRGFSLKLSKSDYEAITEIVIPNGITKIEAGAFEGLTNLTSVVIPDSVKEIEADAFKGCTSLQNVKLSKKLVSLGESAFEGCTLLEEVVLAKTVEKVGKNAFKDCAALTIYTNYNVAPNGFDPEWNASNCKVYLDKQWGHDDDNPERIHLLSIYANGGEYTLEDDEYFEEGEIATLPTPTKKGCEFLGWYTTPDFKETTKLTSDIYTMNGDVSVYAKWNENVYNIKYNLDGGSLANMVTTYKVGDTVLLGTPTKPGYTFIGWQGTGIEGTAEVVEFSGEIGDREYKAVFKANIYTITFNANGGSGTGTIKVEFNTTTKLTVNNFSWNGMKLVEWNTEKDGTGTSYKINQEIKYTEVGNMTLYAVWASLVTLDPGKNATVEGTAPRLTPGLKNFVIPVPTTKEYLFFEGWYLGEQQITDSDGKALAEWKMSTAVTLTAKWIDKLIIDENTAFVYRGEYPQTRVTDAALIEALSKLKSTNSRGYYSYNGEQYAKVIYNNAATTAKFNDGTKLVYGKTYFFKVEKILWRVLSDSKGLVISEYILDAIEYYDNNETRTYFDSNLNTERQVSPNNYPDSVLSAWLNDGEVNRHDQEKLEDLNYSKKGFATKAFSDVTKYVQFSLEIDNSQESTKATSNPYVDGNSEGFFFALSHKEFADDYAKTLGKGVVGATDYAIAKELKFDSTAKSAAWWLRSPYHANAKRALCVTANGKVDSDGELVTDSTIGVRPAMYLR